MAIEAKGFYRDSVGVALSLDREELQILLSLLADLRELIRPEPMLDSDPLAEIVGIDESAALPSDEAMVKLFPDAYSDDDTASMEFRRFTERGLRQRRMDQSKIVQELFERAKQGPTTLTEPESRATLGVLNDLRMVLGVRLGIEQDDDSREDFISHDDPRRHMYVAYQWLTWLQQELLESMTKGR